MEALKIGILALQGAVQPHVRKLTALGAQAAPVRRAEEFASLHGLILPGGESSTFLNLIAHYGMEQPLRDLAATRPLWGVCAGSILMATRVENPTQHALGLLPLTVTRNAYGAQNESFITTLELSLPGEAPGTCEGVFIRAPRFTDLGPQAQVLARHGTEPVAVRHGIHMAAAFHPELSEESPLHAYFLRLCAEQARKASA